MGHGEWIQIEHQYDSVNYGNNLEAAPEWEQNWLSKNDPDVKLHNEVRRRGYLNQWGARIRVESKWNLQLFANLLTDYEDSEIVEWIKYGWPTGRLPTLTLPGSSFKNHKGASDYPEALQKYIEKESSHGAII